MSLPKTLALALGSAVLAVAMGGCQGQTSAEPPIVPIRNMHEQPRYDPQERSHFFADGRTMRPEVPHTLPVEAVTEEPLATGLDADGNYLVTIPEPVVDDAGDMDALVQRGQDRYAIYCVPCHGGLGDGQGMVGQVSRVAAIQPPSFHQDRIRHMADGQLFATITNGIRNMPAYGPQVAVRDRWAIVSYVRALQLAQADQRTAMRTEMDR